MKRLLTFTEATQHTTWCSCPLILSIFLACVEHSQSATACFKFFQKITSNEIISDTY